MKSAQLTKHLDEEHKLSPLSSYLKEIVYGASDGIVTTFAVVAGFAGAQQSSPNTYPILIVLLFGLANLAADGASMGLSNFLSLRSEQDLYNLEKEKEFKEIESNTKMEFEETIDILKSKGYSPKDAQDMATLYSKNKEYWTDFMMHHELELPNPSNEIPHLTGFVTFIAFVTFGFIPLIPYVLMSHTPRLFTLSCIFTLSALVLLGILRWRVTKHTIFRSVGEVVLVGSVSAIFAFVVGTFFRL